jgi:hypothetical protein
MDRARTLFSISVLTLPVSAAAQSPASQPAPFPGLGIGSLNPFKRRC